MSAQRRIAIFLPGLYGGGAERTMLNLAGGIAARRVRVDLVLAQATGPYLDEIPDSVHLVDLKASRSLASLPALVRYLRRERPDAMLAALSRANLIALWARGLAGLPAHVAVNEQNTLSQWAGQSPDWRRKLTLRLARMFYGWADSVVGVSQGVVDDLVREVGIEHPNMRVIFNPGISPEVREKAEEELDHPWFRAGEPPVLLTVGRLHHQKDYPTLLRAFARLRETHEARLLFLGEGRERQPLEALASELGVGDAVGMPGFVGNPYAYMKRAAVFVMSSRWEGLPTVLVEAQFCGMRIVSTDCPSGPREILRGGELGHLVPMESPDALAEAVGRALDGDIPVARTSDWQPYTLESVSDQYIELLLGPQAAPSVAAGDRLAVKTPRSG